MQLSVKRAMDHAMSHDDFLGIEAASVPKLNIKVIKDRMACYNLQVAIEGNAHLYANGVKFGRLHSEWMHLDALPSGEILIEVSLNKNEHRPLVLVGTPVVQIR